jgi:DNA-binding GntR family transcriptional regulator
MFQTKEDRVADFLREAIVSNRFARGSKLRQADIAALIGTSITPVREALKLLEAEGFVVGNSHRGAIVAPFSTNAGEEIMELRILLEGRLVLAALPNLSNDDLREIERLHEEFQAAVAADAEVRGVNYRFHELIYAAAQLPETLRFVRTLWARYPFELINRLPGRLDRVANEHRSLLDGLVLRSGSASVAALVDHIRSGWAELNATRGANFRDSSPS